MIDNLSLGVSLIHARSDTLQTLHDENLVGVGRDADGRFIYDGRIVDGQIWKIDRSQGTSRYTAGHLRVQEALQQRLGRLRLVYGRLGQGQRL